MSGDSEKRRICWPNPDATCLEGGCMYCSSKPLRSVDRIRRWAESAGPVPNRYGNEKQDALTAFEYGESHYAGRS